MNESKMTGMPKIKRIILHHAAYEFKSFPIIDDTSTEMDIRKGAEAIFNEVDSWHLKRWSTGCGYHFAIGNGRGIGDGSIKVWRPLKYQGVHTKGQNHDSIGIMLLGALQNKLPSRKQVDAVVHIAATLCNLYALDPMGEYNEMRFVLRNQGPVISGHRDWRGHEANDCPGGLYELLPSIRKSVRSLMGLESPVSGIYLGTGDTRRRT